MLACACGVYVRAHVSFAFLLFLSCASVCCTSRVCFCPRGVRCMLVRSFRAAGVFFFVLLSVFVGVRVDRWPEYCCIVYPLVLTQILRGEAFCPCGQNRPKCHTTREQQQRRIVHDTWYFTCMCVLFQRVMCSVCVPCMCQALFHISWTCLL